MATVIKQYPPKEIRTSITHSLGVCMYVFWMNSHGFLMFSFIQLTDIEKYVLEFINKKSYSPTSNTCGNT